MLSNQNIESELSFAYLLAIASRGGVICERAGRHSDDAGVDAVLRVKGKLAEDSILTQFSVDVQLKATKKPPSEKEGAFSHSLKIKNYNELRSEDTAAPQLLVVLLLPEDEGLWLVHGEDCLVSRRCAYWLSLRGAPESLQDSKTVHLPRSNALSVEGLRNLMVRISRREYLHHEG